MTFAARQDDRRIPPLLASHLMRRRLDGRWSDCAGRKLILVTAGAGSGKTSFIAERARSDGRCVVWYTLSEDDAEPGTFLTHIGEATLPASSALLLSGEDAISETGRRLLDRILRPLEARRGHVLFILDDAQILAGVDVILRLLEYWARSLPEGSSLLIASREPLDLRIAKLRSLGAVASITAQDLRFDEAEVAALFRRRFPEAEIDSKVCRQIVAQTEGWAAGIAILLQATCGSTSWAILRALEGLARAGSGWFSYFAEEVVSREDAETQSFLLRSSVLPRLVPEICDSVLGIPDSRRIMERLAERNLFTFQVGETPVAYRYHNLFREFLQEQLLVRVEPGEVGRLRRRAAEALATTGAWAEAAATYAEVGDPAAALHVIETYGDDLLATGQYQAIRRTFAGMPSPLLSKRPIALSVLGRLQEVQGQWNEAADTYRLALRSRPAAALRAELMIFLAQIHMRRGAYGPAGNLCRKALREATVRHPRIRVAALCLLGLVAAEIGRLDEAEKQFTLACKLARKSGDAIGEAKSLFLQAVNVHSFRGDFREAKDAARRALLVFQNHADQRRISHTMGVLGFLSMCTADERDARDLTESALRLAETLGYRMIEGYCRYTLGKCALLTGDPVSAKELFEHARRIGEELQEPALLTLPRIAMAEAALAEGNRHAARATAHDALGLARARKDRFQEALCLVLLGLTGRGGEGRGARGDRGRTDDLAAAERIFRGMGASYELNRLLLIRLEADSFPEKVRAARLKELLESVATRGHDFLFLTIDPARAARVLPMALQMDIETDYVMSILVRLGASGVPHLRRLLADPQEAVRERAVEVLARIGGDEARAALSKAADVSTRTGRAARKAVEELALAPSVPLQIRALGSMEVRIDGLKIDRDGWRSGRALRLFQLLLVHRFRWIPKDEVLETLWPEIDPEKSEISLRQSVLLLRKTLEPALEETRMSRYIRFRGNAYRLDPGKGSSYDVESFEELLRTGASSRGAEKPQQAEARLRRAIELYRGGFMSESPYEEFLAAERERLADLLLRALDRLLESSAECGGWESSIPLSRRGLQIDPYRETFHCHLVQAHLALGNRQEALLAYHHYEKVMRSELGLPPSGSMRRLAERAAAVTR